MHYEELLITRLVEAKAELRKELREEIELEVSAEYRDKLKYQKDLIRQEMEISRASDFEAAVIQEVERRLSSNLTDWEE